VKRAAIFFVAFAAASAFGGEVQDVTKVVIAPVHWKLKQWTRFGEGVALVVGVAAVDRPLIGAIQRNRSNFSDQFARRITPIGANDAVLASWALLGSGFLFHNDTLRGAGRDAIESEIVAASMATPVIKRLAGRARPFRHEGTFHFDPDQSHSGNFQSFPSGHATNAFAAATAIAGHFDGWVVPTIVYTIATGVSFSRVNDNVHFPSDVVAGALIGRAVAKGILARHHVSVVPEKHGLLFVYRFAGE